MIKVNFKELRKNSKDLGEQTKVSTSNAVAEKFSKVVKDKVKGIKCNNHPNNTRGTIDIKADLNKIIIIAKHNFCCPELQNSIQIPIKR